MSFEKLNLIEPLLRAIKTEGYETPTAVQAQAIPLILEGRDVLGSAQTGTGKTAAFALPVLQLLEGKQARAESKKPLVLVLAPTRELALQIEKSFRTYGRNLRIKTTLVYGGVGYGPQISALRNGVHVLIATPGRLFDLLEQNAVSLSKIEFLILDEADRMLDMGFLPAIREVVQQAPQDAQKLLFSATMPGPIRALADRMLKNPASVTVAPTKQSDAQITQHAYFVERDKKRELLLHLFEDAAVERSVVFTRTKFGADKISDYLNRSRVRAAAIHGNKSQRQREQALQAFKTGKARVLVATDVASRGIDIDGVTHVINYELPNDPESYVHRIGRTGRAGATGVAWSLCDREERSLLAAIEREMRTQVPVNLEHPFAADFGPLRSGSTTRSFGPGRRPSRPRWQQNRAQKSQQSRYDSQY